MQTEILKVTSESIDKAVDILLKGGIIGMPTETVYGLAGVGFDSNAVKEIYRVKGRPSDNPLIIHVAGADEVERYCSEIPEAAVRVMERFWPGPVTMVLKKKDNIGI